MNARAGFTIESAADSNLRRAALALYAAEQEDQAWLLAQLGPIHRASLEAMLGELASLGLTRDRTVIDECLRDSSGAKVPAQASLDRAPTPPPAPQRALNAVRSARDRDLVAVLEGEPPILIAHLLAHLPENARSRFLKLLAASVRIPVQDLLRLRYPNLTVNGSTDAAPSLSEALLQEVAERLVRVTSGTTVLQCIFRRISGFVSTLSSIKLRGHA